MRISLLLTVIVFLLFGCKKDEETTPEGSIQVWMYESSKGLVRGDFYADLYIYKDTGANLVAEMPIGRLVILKNKATDEDIKPTYRKSMGGSSNIEFKLPYGKYVFLAVSQTYANFSLKNVNVDSPFQRIDKTFSEHDEEGSPW